MRRAHFLPSGARGVQEGEPRWSTTRADRPGIRRGDPAWTGTQAGADPLDHPSLGGRATRLPVEGRLASFAGATRWLNSEPLTPEGLRGRVVLVDFWTYTCVNWLRTLPYVRAWAAKYADAGLTVVGVHTPEFDFEHDLDNVTAQARTLAVQYPVAVDNDYGVWRAFANHYWPAVYLADAEGRLRYHHFGEGEYAMTEMVIQQLLLEAGANDVDQDLVVVEPRGLEVAADWQTLRSPETYLGYAQSTGFASRRRAGSTRRTTTPPHRSCLSTTGTSPAPGRSPARRAPRRAGRAARVPVPRARCQPGHGPRGRGKPIPFRVFLDGQPAAGAAGTDVAADGHGTVTDQRTYQLIRQPGRSPSAASRSSSSTRRRAVLLHLRLTAGWRTRTRRQEGAMPDTLPTDTTPGLGRRAVLGGATALAASAALPAFPAPAGDGHGSAPAVGGCPAWQLRLVPRAGRHDDPEQAAQEPAADPARPGRRGERTASVTVAGNAMKLAADHVSNIEHRHIGFRGGSPIRCSPADRIPHTYPASERGWRSLPAGNGSSCRRPRHRQGATICSLAGTVTLHLRGPGRLQVYA